ncbi:MAG TPA: ATP synthase F0 subunit C [Clostridium sp.]|nr:ATP synthase F0 subunit C [Clostridium sp.]
MDSTSAKAISAAVTIGLGAAAAAIAMGIAIGKSSESIARQPEAKDSIRTSLLLGLVFIETAVIYALVVAIMIIFVL